MSSLGPNHQIHKFINKLPLVNPNDDRYFYFTLFMMGVILWNVITIPVLIANGEETLHHPVLYPVFFTINFVFDLIFWFEVLGVNFRLSYTDFSGTKTDARDIFINYVSSSLWFELLAMLPVGSFIYGDLYLQGVLRLPRLLKLKDFSDKISTWALISENNQIVAFYQMFFNLILYLHFLACMYLYFSYQEGFGETSFVPPIEAEDYNFWQIYLVSIRWSTSSSTGIGAVELPTNDAETLFTTAVCSFGYLIYGYVTGKIVDIMTDLNARHSQFAQKMGQVALFIKNKRIPEEMGDKITTYFRHLWSKQGGFDDEALLSELPLHLQLEVTLALSVSLVEKVQFLSSCSEPFKRAIVQVLRPVIYLPGDTIVSQGEKGAEMYFIQQGQVEVLIGETRVATLKEGSFFGEIAILFDQKRTATIKALPFCDLSVLKKKDFANLLKEFPDQKKIVMNAAKERMAHQRTSKVSEDRILNSINHPDKGEFMKELGTQFPADGFVYEANTLVWAENDVPRHLYWLGFGSYTIRQEGFLVEQNSVSANDYKGFLLGLIEFVLQVPFKTRCQIKGEATVLLRISRKRWNMVCQKYKDFAQLLIDECTELYRVAQKKAEDRASKLSSTTPEPVSGEEWFEQFQSISDSNVDLGQTQVYSAIQYLLRTSIERSLSDPDDTEEEEIGAKKVKIKEPRPKEKQEGLKKTDKQEKERKEQEKKKDKKKKGENRAKKKTM